MIYIGLDQSSKVIGYAVMNDTGLLDHGVYRVPENKDLMWRVSYVLHFLEQLVDEYNSPDMIIGLEDTQESRMNTNTFQLLTKVLGIIEYWLWSENINYKVCHVSSWRSHAGVKGKRREDKKKHAIQIVEKKFGIKAEEDAAEAILITEYLRGETS